MATKTLTIMEDAYRLLADNKLENESFSEEVRRILSRKKARKLSDYFGVLSKETGNRMAKDLERIEKEQLKLTKERIVKLR